MGGPWQELESHFRVPTLVDMGVCGACTPGERENGGAGRALRAGGAREGGAARRGGAAADADAGGGGATTVHRMFGNTAVYI